MLISLTLLFVSSAPNDAPAAIYAKGNKELQVQWIKRVWSKGPHNAFPDAEHWKGKWYVAVREGTAHGIAGFGRVRIISSKDSENWRSVALFDDFGDYRRAELSVMPDGRLMVLSKFNKYAKANNTQQRRFTAQDYQGKSHIVFAAGVENRVAFTKDGTNWTEPQAVHGTHPNSWFYSGVQWHKGIGYAIDRQGRKLYQTRDGLNFAAIADVPVGNESRISFLPNSTMIVFFRNGSLAQSPPSYMKWTLNATNKKGPHSYGGPGIIALPNGAVWAASRHRIAPNDFEWPAKENKFPNGTVLFKLLGKKLVPKLLIRGGGDRGYNGLVWHADFLWMAYNAPSRELRKSCIYFAKIKLNP